MQFLTEMCNDCNATLGDAGVPVQVVELVGLIYSAIKILVPVILIIVGMIDMAKAVTSKDEKEIKTAQTLLVRKAVTAVLVFLILSLVAMIFKIVSRDDDDKDSIWDCIASLLNGVCNETFGAGDGPSGP